MDEPAAARRYRPALDRVAELLDHEVPERHPRAPGDAGRGGPQLQLLPGRVVGQVDLVRGVVPEELAGGQLAQRPDLPQAPTVQEHLVDVDAHALRDRCPATGRRSSAGRELARAEARLARDDPVRPSLEAVTNFAPLMTGAPVPPR